MRRVIENKRNVLTVSVERACVILGAGASYDVGGEGSPIKQSDFRPPLAIDLFNIKKHPSYWDVMRHYKGAMFLGQELAQKSSSGAIGIERELKRYADHENEVIREHFKHIPAYLRDLLFRASRDYTYVPSSYIQLVQKLLADYPHDVLFLILNYDTLLESALALFNSEQFRFSDINQYVEENQNVKVVKLHGSINWFRCLPGSGNERWDSAVADFDISEPLPEHEIVVQDSGPEVRDIVIKDNRVYPVLTAPLAGKGLTDAVCPQSHIIAAKEFISSCSKFLIIGTSGLDEDLLELLDTTIDPMRGVLVNIVDEGEGAGNAYNRFVKGVRAFRHTREAGFMTIYREGFVNYLPSQQFQKFVTSRM